jgi:hypothetical protein
MRKKPNIRAADRILFFIFLSMDSSFDRPLCSGFKRESGRFAPSQPLSENLKSKLEPEIDCMTPPPKKFLRLRD